MVLCGRIHDIDRVMGNIKGYLIHLSHTTCLYLIAFEILSNKKKISTKTLETTLIACIVTKLHK